MMTSQTNSSVEELLRQLSDEKAMVLLPAILYVGILMVVGFLGNGLVCFIFVRKLKPGTQNIMILCLAASDFLVCSIGMPTEITDMRFDYTFESEFACKLLRFVNALSTIWSDFTLVAIAVDRYIKVCRPFGRQMTVRDAKTAVLVSLLIAILLSWPMLFIFGTRSKDTGIPGLFGKDCSTSDAMKGTNYPLIYNSILFVCFVLVTIVFIVLYAKIYRTVKRQKVVMDKARKYNASTEEYATSESVNRLDTSAESGKQNQISPTIFTQTADSLIKNDASMVNSKEDKTVSVDRTHSLTSKVSVDEPTLMKVSSHFTVDLQKSVTSILPPTDMLGVDAERTKQEVKSSKKSRKENKLGPESRTTLIAFLVTIVFVLSYLPYLGMTFSSIFNKGYNHHLRGPSLAAYNLFLRSYFVNSAVNPIIYGLLNPKFSRAVKAMFKGPTCCRPSRIYDLD